MSKINFIVKRWKKITPKWDNEELSEYIEYLHGLSSKRINEIYNNQVYLASEKCDREVQALTDRLYNNGMLDVDNMQPENALD